MKGPKNEAQQVQVETKKPEPQPPGDGAGGSSEIAPKSKGQGTGGSGSSIDNLLSEAATLMKTFRPSVKAVILKKAQADPSKTGLLDGGATNALGWGSEREIAEAVKVTVELASGSTELWHCVSTGTLLSSVEVEPIVPLRGLVDLDDQISWNSEGCVISHPKHGRIRCWLRNGCPVVQESHALALIAEIEDQERLRRLGPGLALGQVSDATRKWWKERFPLVPDDVLQFMVGQGEKPDPNLLPWNRKLRKRFEHAQGLIIHLYAGNSTACKEWDRGWPSGIEMISVDIRTDRHMDMNDKNVWGYLSWLVTQVSGRNTGGVSQMRNLRPGPSLAGSVGGSVRIGGIDHD